MTVNLNLKFKIRWWLTYWHSLSLRPVHSRLQRYAGRVKVALIHTYNVKSKSQGITFEVWDHKSLNSRVSSHLISSSIHLIPRLLQKYLLTSVGRQCHLNIPTNWCFAGHPSLLTQLYHTITAQKIPNSNNISLFKR